MATATRPWTRADLDRFPDDGNRYEVLDGELLVTPSPSRTHQIVALRLARILGDYCDHYRIGYVMAPGAAPRGKSELQPDILATVDPTRPIDARWDETEPVGLVVEVLSPGSRAHDQVTKRAAYRRWGFPEYWVVDTDARAVTVARQGHRDRRVTDTLRWQPKPDVPPLVIGVERLFT
ncbi:MAG: Uma2 family endonuclease [Gemmatimonadaceae bacterium]